MNYYPCKPLGFCSPLPTNICVIAQVGIRVYSSKHPNTLLLSDGSRRGSTHHIDPLIARENDEVETRVKLDSADS